MTVLYGNDAFSVLVLSTKKRCSSFLKMAFVFQKICFKVIVLKMFKISTDCLIKTCRSLKRREFWKSLVPLFRGTYALPVCFEMNPLKKTLSGVKTKGNPNFAVKLVESSNRSFLLSIWWITFFKHLYSLIRGMECVERNWSCKHIKKIRSSQAAIDHPSKKVVVLVKSL